jgi:hypothetical protein
MLQALFDIVKKVHQHSSPTIASGCIMLLPTAVLHSQALHVINSVKTDPCGNIRRVNVEIPTLSVSDMRRLKATDCVSTAISMVMLAVFFLQARVDAGLAAAMTSAAMTAAALTRSTTLWII